MKENVSNYKEEKENQNSNKTYYCLFCNKPFTEDYRKDKKGEPKFCCKKCDRTYSSHQLDQTKTKLIECTICHELKEVNIHCSPINFICEECKEKQKKEEKRNNENSVLHIPYKYPENCVLGKFERSKAYKQKSINLIKMGFDFDDFNWEEEFFRIQYYTL